MNYTISLSAQLSSVSANVSTGILVSDSGTGYAPGASNPVTCGIALSAGSAGQAINIQTSGLVPAAVAGLGAGTATHVVANIVTGVTSRKSNLVPSDFYIGECDASGNLTLNINRSSSQVPAAVFNLKPFFVVTDKGATGGGLADDSAAFINTAALGAGVCYVPPGTYKISQNVSMPSSQRVWIDRGASISVDAGVTFSIGGRFDAHPQDQVFTGAGAVSIASSSTGSISAKWWGDKQITLASPGAPACSAWNVNPYTGVGHTFQVAFALVADDGVSESALSTATSIGSATSAWVQDNLPQNIAQNAAAVRWYMKRDDDANWKKANQPYPNNQHTQPTDAGYREAGPQIQYNASGTTRSGTGTVGSPNDRAGNALPSPAAVTPIAFIPYQIPANTTYKVALAYTADDGTGIITQTALSPAVSVTSGANGGAIVVQMPDPPSGALTALIFMSVDGGATWHQQDEIPVGLSTREIHAFNGAGAAPNPGSAAALVSGIQQALDACVSFGGSVEVPPGHYDTHCPIRLSSPRGTTNNLGIRVCATGGIGRGSLNLPDTSTTCIRYVGAKSSSISVAYCWSNNNVYENIEFSDPNKNADFGLLWGAFTGGDAFHNIFNNCVFRGLRPGVGVGMGCIKGSTYAQAGTACANNEFRSCWFWGDVAAVDFHNNQAVANRFSEKPSVQILNANGLAKACDVRWSGGAVTWGAVLASGQGHASLALTCDDQQSLSQTTPTFVADEWYVELYAGQKGITTSGYLTRCSVLIRRPYVVPAVNPVTACYPILLGASGGSPPAVYDGDWFDFGPMNVVGNGIKRLGKLAGGMYDGSSSAGPLSCVSGPDYTRAAKILHACAMWFLPESAADVTNALASYLGTNASGDIVAHAGSKAINLNGTRIIVGTGSPNATITGSPGDLYINSSGGAATTLYVKESGAGTNTGWVGK